MIILGKPPERLSEEEVEALHSSSARAAGEVDAQARWKNGASAGYSSAIRRVRLRVGRGVRAGRGDRRRVGRAPPPRPRPSGTSPRRPPRAAPPRTPRPRSCRRSRSRPRGRRPGSGARAGWRSRRLTRGPGVGAGMPGADHQVEPVAQPEGDALEDGARQVAPVVGERQADERAARQRIRVRAALAAEVGKEPQPVAARRARRRPVGDELVERARRARACRGTSAGCRPPRASPTSGASAPGTAWQKAWTRPSRLEQRRVGRGEDRRPTCPSDSATVPGRDGAHADRVRRLIAAAGDDGRAGAQAGAPRRAAA